MDDNLNWKKLAPISPKLWGHLLYIYLYFVILNNLLKCTQCMLMPEIIPLFTLTFRLYTVRKYPMKLRT